MRTPALVCVLSLPLVVAVAACSSSSPEGECVGASGDALKVCAGPTTVKGIDVSVYQGTVNWSQVKGAGVQFAFVRVSDGKNSLDTQFANNWKNTKTAGVIRGTYQFFRPSQDPIVQADLLLSQLSKNGGMQPGDLPPVLDLEWNSHSRTCPIRLSAEAARAKIDLLLTEMERHFGKRPIIYTDITFHKDVLEGHYNNYSYWLRSVAAHPTERFNRNQFHFWQYTATGTVPGIRGPVDRNVFHGTERQWQAFLSPGQSGTAVAAVAPQE